MIPGYLLFIPEFIGRSENKYEHEKILPGYCCRESRSTVFRSGDWKSEYGVSGKDSVINVSQSYLEPGHVISTVQVVGFYALNDLVKILAQILLPKRSNENID